MPSKRVASRYAKSLFELARDTEKLEVVYRDISLISRTFSANRNLGHMLLNPVIRYDYKLRILQRVFQKHIGDLTYRFLELLSRKGRAELLLEICTAFTKYYYEQKGLVVAQVTGAVPLGDEIKSQISEYVNKHTGKEVLLEEKTEDDLIGGFILRVGDRQLDSSLRGMLRQLKKEFGGK